MAMKKVTLLVAVLIVPACIIVYLFKDLSNPSLFYEGSLPITIQTALNAALPAQKLTMTSDDPEAQAQIAGQRKETTVNFSQNVANIHAGLIHALELELRSGKSERDLLRYSHEYQIYNKSCSELMLNAKINIAKEKLNYTISADILSNWQGLSVIDNVSDLIVPVLVKALKEVEGMTGSMSIVLELEPDPDNCKTA